MNKSIEIAIVLENAGLNALKRNGQVLQLDFNPNTVNVIEKGKYLFTMCDLKFAEFCGKKILQGTSDKHETRIVPVEQIEHFLVSSHNDMLTQKCDLILK